MRVEVPAIELPKSSGVTATDRVFDALYDAVISVKLPPGTKVSEYELAKQLDVSRQPVRDAFFRLSSLGFLAIRPQRPTLITQISLRAIHDAVFTRTALEAECLRVALVVDKPRLIKDMQESIAAHKRAASGDAAGFHAIDEAFHELICKVSGHDHVWPLIRQQKAHLDRLRYLSLSEERRKYVIADHTKILDAIVDGTAAKAEQLLRGHITAVKDTLPAMMDLYPEYFEITSTRD
ncbi:GntR family transcriptional regulator [Shimia sp.]|uniref:GntR family transcriptional regulator n=1 Tax=Shimia sp. TaxID=1954381 RepID=UPI003298EBA7